MDITKGIVLRSIKYGETSLVLTLFTEAHGIQAFMMQGARTSKARGNRAGYLQPGMLLEIVMHYQPQKSLQRIKEYQAAYIYQAIQQDVIKNTVTLFSVELLLRLLPEHAPMPELFEFAYTYFIELDKASGQVGNYPLYFITRCSFHLGFELNGKYSPVTPYLNLQDGGFSSYPPPAAPFMTDEEGALLSKLLEADNYAQLQQTYMNGATRLRLIHWYISFLQVHSQHIGHIKSLAVMQAILH